jgi:indolepyruvate ferredoxin oxidoreductase beta subunit
LHGFAEGFARAGENRLPELSQAAVKSFASPPVDAGDATLNQLLHRIRSFPETLHPIIFAGVKRAVNFQDAAYGGEYLDRLETLHALDAKSGGTTRGYAFTAAAAKHLANALAYDDVVAVADAKTRASRFARIEKEASLKDGEPYHLTEFMHPRAQELVGLLPAKFGERIARSEKWMRRIDRLVNRGRRVRTTSLLGFLQLRSLSALRPLRRKLLRHAEETTHVDHWLSLARAHVATNYGLAEGIVAARRLIKGYSDTHARGLSKYDRVLSAVPLLADRADAGDWMRRLIAAALKDENGDGLDGALKTIRTL